LTSAASVYSSLSAIVLAARVGNFLTATAAIDNCFMTSAKAYTFIAATADSFGEQQKLFHSKNS
jgi:hypothetical protein